MTQENNDIKATPARNKSRWRKPATALIIIVLLMGVLQYVGYYCAVPLFKERICNAVQQKSKGLYTMDFSDLRINFIGQSIVLENFSLRADTSVYLDRIEKEHYNKAIYSISVSALKIKHIGLKSFFSKNELYIKAITMDSPVIRLVGKPDKSEVTKAKYDAVHTDLYPLLKPYFNALNIRKIEIRDGYFDFHMRIHDSQEQFGISKIDITLKKFYLNEEKFIARNQFYYSEEIEIGSNNYVINLADSIHRITAEHLEIKTLDSTIHATHVKMSSNGRSTSQKNRFDVSLNEITINGLDISRAYFDKVVNLSNVTIKQPTIKFSQGGKVNKQTKKFEASQDGWYSLIRGTLRGISIDSLQVDGASISISKPLVTDKPIYNVGNVNLLMEGFLLDSLAHRNRNKILYSNDLTVVLNDYHMILPDQRHLLTAENLMVSTKTQVVHADRINIRPARYTSDSTAKTMRISIPMLDINGIDMKKAYNQRDFEIGNLKIQNPQINTTSYIDSTHNHNHETETKQPSGRGKLLTALSEEFFHSLRIRNLSIYKGRVDITSKAYIQQDSLTLSGKLTLNIGNFLINGATLKDEILPFHTSSVKINLENVIVKPSRSLHTLRCDNFTIDTRNDNVTISRLSYTAKSDTSLIHQLRRLGKHSIMDIRIEKTEFSQADLLDAIYHGRINIENVRISSPQFQMNVYPQLRRVMEVSEPDTLSHDDSLAIAEQDSILAKFSNMERLIAQSLPKELSLIKIDTLAADSCLLKFIMRDTMQNITTGTASDFRFNVNGFYYNRDSVSPEAPILFSNGFMLDINNFQFMLPDKTHIVRTGNININTYDKLIRSNVITIMPADTIRAKGKRQIIAYCPKLDITGVDFAEFNQTGRLPIDSCSINNSVVMIVKPQTAVMNSQPQKEQKKKAKIFSGLFIKTLTSLGNSIKMQRDDESPIMKIGFDFACKNLSIDSANIASKNHLLTFDSTYMNVDEFLVKIKDNELTASSIHQEGDTLRILDARFGNPDDSIQNHYSVDKIEITKPDLEAAAFDRKISLHSMYIQNPFAYLLTGQKKTPKAANTGSKKPFSIVIDSLSADGARIHLDRRLKDKPDLDFPNMDLLAVGINTETEHESAFPADKVSAGINNFTYILKDTLMRFHFGRVELDPIHQIFVADQVDYRPRVGRYEYFKLFDTRRSANYVNCAKMKGYGFNIVDFVKTMKMDLTRVEVDRFAFLNYEDKTMPLDSSRKPTLFNYIFEKLPIKVKVDTAVVRNSFLEMEQLTPEVGIPGVLTLNGINGIAYNFTNDTNDIKKDDKMKVTASGMLMNQSKVYANIMYDLDSPTEEFICNFKADSIYLPILNPYLENGIRAKVEDGVLTRGVVYFKSDNNESRGKTQLIYRDLKLSLNKKDSVQEHKRGLLSFVANTVLRTKNTRKIGYIYARPDSSKSFAGYWMQSLLSGAKSTVGFESKEQKGDRRIGRKLIDAVTRKKRKENYILEVPNLEEILSGNKTNDKTETK